MSKTLAWQTHLDGARQHAADLARDLGALTAFRNESVAEIALLGKSAGVGINLDAVQALFSRPYMLIPTNDPNEWYLVLSRIVNAPAVGWIISQNDAFTVSRITRTMNVLSPLPAWVREETNWAEPEHDARISLDHSTVTVLRGDRESFRKRYAPFLGKPTLDGFEVKKTNKGFIRFVVQMVKEGILPHTPKPVVDADWDENAKCDIVLRDYQIAAVEAFRANGAVSLIAPMGAGKMYTLGYIAAHLCGESLVLAPGSALVDSWKMFFATYAPNARVKIATYQWALTHLKELQKTRLTFLALDELHRIPANDFSQLAYLPVDYRAGATGTPWREDDRTPLIVALAGPPSSIPWNAMIERGILLRPRVVAEIVNGDADKVKEIKRLLERHRSSRALVYCDSIQKGKDLARTLDLPFVHGETKNQLALIKASSHCIVSRVGDYGLDLTDLTLVVEYDYLGKSRVQSAQRMGRLMHSRMKGEHVTLFTLDEYAHFGDRLLGIRAEFGDIEIVDLTGGNVKAQVYKSVRRLKIARSASVKPGDEAGLLLALPPIARIILDHEVKLGKTRQGYMAKCFRILYKSEGSSTELRLREGKSVKTWEPWQAAFNMLVKSGLAKQVDGRYYLDRAQVNAYAK